MMQESCPDQSKQRQTELGRVWAPQQALPQNIEGRALGDITFDVKFRNEQLHNMRKAEDQDMHAIDGRPTIVAQVSTPKAQNKQQPLPQQLLQQKPHHGWSDSSSSNAGSSQKKSIHYMPKPKAVRDKHIFDPEHGGGRRRRDKHLPKRKFYEENSDKIGDRLNFHARIGLDCVEESPR
jgi:hypothetical protein